MQGGEGNSFHVKVCDVFAPAMPRSAVYKARATLALRFPVRRSLLASDRNNFAQCCLRAPSSMSFVDMIRPKMIT